MAKRKSSSRSSSIPLGGIVIIGVLLVIAGVLFGWDVVANMVSEATGITFDTIVEEVASPGAPVDSGQLPAETSGSTTGAFTVYFTNPVIPFDDVVTGGLDGRAVELINNATTSIDAAMFEFNLQSVADALIAAHNRGVRVRIVYDDEHTEDDPQIEQLIDAGIPAVPDERSAFMHNKFYVFDGSIVWTGSMNFTENGAYRNNNNAIVIRSSQLAQNYTTEFEEMFNGEFGPTSPANTPNPTFTLDGIRIENYFASEDEVMPALVAAVNGAQTSIHFLIFSFTEDSLGEAILARGQAGVEVAGIFETRGANTEFSECPRLLAGGFDVRLDTNPRTFHHKVIIIDGSIVATGSFNFSDNATTSNDENLVIIHSPDVAAQYEAEFNRRLAQSEVPVGGECLGPDDD